MSGELGLLSGDFEFVEGPFTPGGAAIVIAKRDPSRWAITVGMANPGQPVWISRLSTVGANNGIPLVANSPLITWNFRDVGSQVQEQWFAFSAVGGVVWVIECLYRPHGQITVTDEDMDNLAQKLERGDVLVATTPVPSRWELRQGKY